MTPPHQPGELGEVINQVPPGVTAETVNVTPAIAEKYLQKNTNRPLRADWVNHLTSEMENNRWVFTHEPIAFDPEGNLLDGQHRLRAIINSDKTVALLVVDGITKEAWAKMNRGIKRTTGDQFYIRGHHNSRKTAAGARLLWRYVHNEWRRDVQVDDDELVLFYEEQHPTLMDFNARAFEFSTEVDVSYTVGLVGLYLSSKVDLSDVDPDRTLDDWHDEVIRGVGVPGKTSPARQFRRQMRKRADNKIKTSQRTALGLYARAFIAWVNDEDVKLLRFTDDDPMPPIDDPIKARRRRRRR